MVEIRHLKSARTIGGWISDSEYVLRALTYNEKEIHCIKVTYNDLPLPQDISDMYVDWFEELDLSLCKFFITHNEDCESDFFEISESEIEQIYAQTGYESEDNKLDSEGWDITNLDDYMRIES